MTPPELYIEGRRIQDWAEWVATVVEVRKDEENLSLAAALENVKLIGADADFVKSLEGRTLNLRLIVAGVELRGRIPSDGVLFGRDYVVLSAELDGLQDFVRRVEGRLLDESVRRDVRILVSPREDKATILILVVSIFIVSYIIANETFSLGRDIAVITGITGAGVGGPVSGPIAAGIIAVLRVVYITALVFALVELVRELLNYIDRVITIRGFSLGAALQYFANAAGFSISYPTWLNEVHIVGGGIENWEATEVFRIAKLLTNSILYIQGTQIRFISAQADIPAQYRRAWEEAYKLNTGEVPRRELITLVRDTAEAHCLDVPAAVEIWRTEGRGFARRDISLAPAKQAGERKEVEFVRKFLRVLARFSARIRRVDAQYTGYQDLIITERDIFVPKAVLGDPESPQSAEALLGRIQDAYLRRRIKAIVENVVVPFSAADFQNLAAQGFAGVRSLRWFIAEERAEVEYQYSSNISITENARMI